MSTPCTEIKCPKYSNCSSPKEHFQVLSIQLVLKQDLQHNFQMFQMLNPTLTKHQNIVEKLSQIRLEIFVHDALECWRPKPYSALRESGMPFCGYHQGVLKYGGNMISNPTLRRTLPHDIHPTTHRSLGWETCPWLWCHLVPNNPHTFANSCLFSSQVKLVKKED